ncbi:hypothetical protein [Mycobacterium sp. E1386]|nr:hypothetical protein [Mycobacterium sp. E1386]
MEGDRGGQSRANPQGSSRSLDTGDVGDIDALTQLKSLRKAL